jgi:chromosomal replication initiation ATPase DnaA
MRSTNSATSTADATIALLATRGLLPLVDEICARRGVTRQELCSNDRSRSVVFARHELWCCIYEHPERNYSFPEIARLFGRDHSTVLHGVAAHRRRHAQR